VVDVFEPGSSSTTVLGYQLFRNEVNSHMIPDVLIYDGKAVPNVKQILVESLESGQSYWFAYRVLNRAGWSDLSPILKLIAGKLP